MQLLAVVNTMEIMEFQINFPRYLAQFFELYLHIWHSGSYLNMFLGKIKVFVKHYFLTPVGRFLVKNRIILVEVSTFEDHWILTQI